MTKVCVLIGEGKSEKAFFSSLLMHKLGFAECEAKNCISYQSTHDPELYWIFPTPSYGVTHKGGKRQLEITDKYIEWKRIVTNYQWLFGKHPDVHYRILIDTDNKSPQEITEQKKRIQEAFDAANVTYASQSISIAHIELESWFIAGLDTDFPYLDPESMTNVKRLMREDVDQLIDPKERLDEVLSSGIRGGRERIGSDFGQHINIKSAIEKSKSMSDFWNELKTDGLINP